MGGTERKIPCQYPERTGNPETPDTFHSDGRTFWRYQGK